MAKNGENLNQRTAEMLEPATPTLMTIGFGGFTPNL